MPTMYLNPALTGSLPGWEANVHYRNQWPEISGGYKTLNIGLQKRVDKGNWGLGLNVINDKVGLMTSSGFGLTTTKHFVLGSEIRLGFGLDVALRQKLLIFQV